MTVLDWFEGWRRKRHLIGVAVAIVWGGLFASFSQAKTVDPVDSLISAIESKVTSWRRDIHQNPELGNRETRTSALVSAHLESLGLDRVRTKIAHTGVVGVLKGGAPGPVVALRADMDALPVTEMLNLPFSSKVRTTYNGQDVGVMHACGHDAHTAILMGAAEVLAGMRDELKGSVVFLFQPAEEGVPLGEEGGARMMISDGALSNPAPEVIFGLHTRPGLMGQLSVRTGGAMAGSDQLYITVYGQQTHGAMPSRGVDPITVSAQIIVALQAMVTRQFDAAASPSVVSIGKISGGVRHNIIPDKVELVGTIRHLDPDSHQKLLDRIKRTAELVAESAGARAEVRIRPYAPVVFNPSDLVRKMLPTLERSAGEAGIWRDPPATMGAEDFAYYQRQIPGMYFTLGVNKPGVSFLDAAPNHSPHYYVNDDALRVGVRAMVNLTLDYMNAAQP